MLIAPAVPSALGRTTKSSLGGAPATWTAKVVPRTPSTAVGVFTFIAPGAAADDRNRAGDLFGLADLRALGHRRTRGAECGEQQRKPDRKIAPARLSAVARF